jgi:carbamoyltransferase
MYILGLNAFHGDAAAVLVKDGELIAGVEEERFNRVKHCAGFPAGAIEYCLRAAGIDIEEMDHIGISRDPSAHVHRKVLFAARRLAARRGNEKAQTAATSVSFGNAVGASTADSGEPTLDTLPLPVHDNGNGNGHAPSFTHTLAERLRNAAKIRDLKSELAGALGVSRKKIRAEFHNIEHHRAHLASAFFVSPFDRGALLSLDGFGDFVSTMWGVGSENSIKVLGQVEYPHSLGILYTATTQFLGFLHYGDEGKVMGLAPYGQPRFINAFREIVQTGPHGRFRLNLHYFLHSTQGVEMSWEGGSPKIGRIFSGAFERAFGPARSPDAPLSERDCDLAATLQLRLEEVAFHILNHLHAETGWTDLGLAGGVAYNSVMNGKILRHTPYRRVFVQPAAGDSGTAIGVCYQIWSEQRAKGKAQSAQSNEPGVQSYPANAFADESTLSPLPFALGPYTGPEFSNEEIHKELQISDLRFQTYSDRQLIKQAASDIANGLVVGWFQGRMEFGPRALGNRSILADPRRPEMKAILNDRVKKREPFRPFAPSILAEHVDEYFEQTHPSPAMLMVYQVKTRCRDQIPAVTHLDGTGRLQTVTREDNERFYDLIQAFYQKTGVPVVLNTSFNENEPIVCTPRNAIDCFLKTRIDVLYLGNCAVRREG